MNPVNEHGDMIAISTYRKREADLYDQIYDLKFELAGLRVELEEQARLNGKGSEREAGLLGKVERLERENAALREDKERLEWVFRNRLQDVTKRFWFFTPESFRSHIDTERKEEKL